MQWRLCTAVSFAWAFLYVLIKVAPMIQFSRIRQAASLGPVEYYVAIGSHAKTTPVIRGNTLTTAQIGRGSRNLTAQVMKLGDGSFIVNLHLHNPHLFCGLECKYRYYAIGQTLYGGYLSPVDQGFAGNFTIHGDSTFKFYVLLESLGEHFPGPLPNVISKTLAQDMLTALNKQGKNKKGEGVKKQEAKRKRPFKLNGLFVSDESKVLNATIGKNQVYHLQDHTRCVFGSGRAPFEILDTNSTVFGYYKHNQTFCNFGPPELTHINEAAKQSGVRVNLRYFSTSRVRFMIRDWSVVTGLVRRREGWPTKSQNATHTLKTNFSHIPSLTFFMASTPNIKFGVRRSLEKMKLCKENNTIEFIYLSLGIWEASAGWHDTTSLSSPADYTHEMNGYTRNKVLKYIEEQCPDKKKYRIIWVSQPSVQPFTDKHMPPLASSGKEELLLNGYYSGLGRANAYMVSLSHLYRNFSQEYNGLYVPLQEATMTEIRASDHIHYYTPSFSVARQTLLNAAAVQLLHSLNNSEVADR
mmetsp:Transcript_16346/g.35609  ORF Transcript_16346/g.35609 Transcript_16346/m.35609 type:complete len:525 (-) Transcript_16346:920-2494(-)|eukprot:CAMPEP_0203748534 /NCGR_PEP_ID=MMETSP0098-20131031/3395_1 /ASSEMBLY_ACC=CAM_ASM_000208 /TAXON_ID=96639 /ORGANISM=" , Strain NY0313808BC1" /LENGTH=524 /DNA_ID=CAMNT_0050637309 /DNA_START=444 /DNA_END=2018 /DNA_ORIENTATION=+